MHRAAHQLVDQPPVFTDPLALRIIGAAAAAELHQGSDWRAEPAARELRAFIAARSRLTEDCFAQAMAERGVSQYVLLGAGLDTFAYRAERHGVTVFEVDHPATQGWKRERLAEAEIAIPGYVTFAPVDFERETLVAGLRRAGFDFARPGFFAWLGVTPYLTREAVLATLSSVATATCASSEIMFDYPEPVAQHQADARVAFEALAARVAALGEPFKSAFTVSELFDALVKMGFGEVQDFDAAVLNATYFVDRKDGLVLRGHGHVMRARR